MVEKFLWLFPIFIFLNPVLANCVLVSTNIDYPAWLDVDVTKPTTLEAEATDSLLDFQLIVYPPVGDPFLVDDGFQLPTDLDLEKAELGNPGKWRVEVKSVRNRGDVRVCSDADISPSINEERSWIQDFIDWLVSLFT